MLVKLGLKLIVPDSYGTILTSCGVSDVLDIVLFVFVRHFLESLREDLLDAGDGLRVALTNFGGLGIRHLRRNILRGFSLHE
jgi:hypothetical protein